MENPSATTAAEMPGYLTTQQVQSLLQVSPRALRQMVSSGRFPKPARFGRTVRWERGVVSAHLLAASQGGQ
jgi:predicted DNA-binding transcriptional regulator AlpA